MDLENQLLMALSIYDKHLETLAKFRAVVYEKTSSHESRKLVDELIDRHLLSDMEALVPDEDTWDELALLGLDRREEVIEHMCANGYRDEFDGEHDSLMFTIFGWAAAQSFGRWGGTPWRRLAEVVLDEWGADDD